MNEPTPINKENQSKEILKYPNVITEYNREMNLDLQIENKTYSILLSDEQMIEIVKKYQDGIFDKHIRELILKTQREELDCQHIANNLIG